MKTSIPRQSLLLLILMGAALAEPVHRVAGYQARFTILSAEPTAGSTLPAVFSGFLAKYATPEVPLSLAIGRPSPWVPLDPYLQGQTVQQAFTFSALPDGAPQVVGPMRVLVEIAEGDLHVARSLVESVQG